ncbi:MAG: S9 family peptidase [Bacteroidota bacterium]
MNNDSQENINKTDSPTPPIAAIKPETFHEFGGTRIDDYHWLKEKTNPAVIDYLNAENAYCEAVMKDTKELQETLFQEMKGRIKEDDQTVPQQNNGYYYYSRTEKDKQYPIHCRKKGSLDAFEELVFDVNEMAKDKPAFLFHGYEISEDNRLAAYLYNTTGSFAEYNLKVKDLFSGQDLDFEKENVQSFTMANDNETMFYVIGNKSLRPYQLYRCKLGKNDATELVFEETDDLFNLGVDKSKTKDFIYIVSESFTSSETLLIPANEPMTEPILFLKRQKDVEYHVAHHKDCIFVLYKDEQHKNSMVFEAPISGYENRNTWKEIISHDNAVMIEGMDVFENHLVVFIRKNGLNEIRVMNLKDKSMQNITFPEAVYTVSPMYTPEYSSKKYRYNYASMNRPNTVFDFDMENGTTEMLKQQEVPGGFNADDYSVERLWAKAADGTEIPMAVVYKKTLKRDGKNPALLYAYGSYGINTDAHFRSSVFSLVDRGFVFGIAQIRGGSEMGEVWYESGKLMNKMNTFTDFIACAEHLIKEQYTSSDRLAIMGGSAGGLLMGAVVNLRPELFKVVIGMVPFVDVINTMLDTSLPLTTQEYEQWGNPNEEAAYKYILSYSPYDNVHARDYPDMLITGGLNDSQVSYHEPAKWTAKLRTMNTGKSLILLKTNMESGHGGATGRFDGLKEIAFNYSFIIKRISG